MQSLTTCRIPHVSHAVVCGTKVSVGIARSGTFHSQVWINFAASPFVSVKTNFKVVVSKAKGDGLVNLRFKL